MNTRQKIRVMIASLNEKYPKMPLLMWQDFEDAIVHLIDEQQQETLTQRKCTCWKCLGLKEDPMAIYQEANL